LSTYKTSFPIRPCLQERELSIPRP
jgi:hypothetical protein